MPEISKAGKKELALALLLWKDFKCQGHIDIDFYKQMLELADYIGVREELDELIKEVLFPFEIKLRT